jgi:hypothetical protein
MNEVVRGASSPGESDRSRRHKELMAKYYVPDLGLNSTVDSPLSLILDRLDRDKGLGAEDKKYLRDKGLFDLHRFVNEWEATGGPDFSIVRAPYEADRARKMRSVMRDRYDIESAAPGDMSRLLVILQRLEDGERLGDPDVLWLDEREYFTHEVRIAYHRNEALYCSQCFEQTRDPWHVVNGSSHFRKAGEPQNAVALFALVDLSAIQDKHLRSALCTTAGGAKRDLQDFKEALRRAHEAHDLDPKSFHPCTLLGAVHYELGEYPVGDEWFAKAIARGAQVAGVDSELRVIFRRADKKRQEALRRHLLSVDPSRYAWVNSMGRPGRARRRSSTMK